MRVVSLGGPSGAGKTTAIVNLIRHFVAQGLTVGAIKHTHHPLNEEDRGDTAAFRAAGADPVILAGDGEAVIFAGSSTRRIAFPDPEQLLQHFAADIVLIEGFNAGRHPSWPRIVLDPEHRQTTAELVARLAPFRFVFFDVDSTLVTIEGIDELAGGNTEIARLTDAAMNGEIGLDQVYGRRLEIIRPTLRQVEALGERYIASLVPGAAETIGRLRDAGAQVHLVTAGIAQAIAPLANHLGITPRSVHAVPLLFTPEGEYIDYDSHSFLARPGGKELVVRDVRARSHGRAAFVGDGVSDLEAKPAVDLFIGFGGVHTRPRVRDNADVFVVERDLRAVLPHLIGDVAS